MAIYAGVLAEKAARKRAMQSTAAISLDEGNDAESETDEDEMPNQELLPELKKKSAAKKANAASALKQTEQNQAELAKIANDEVCCIHQILHDPGGGARNIECYAEPIA